VLALAPLAAGAGADALAEAAVEAIAEAEGAGFAEAETLANAAAGAAVTERLVEVIAKGTAEMTKAERSAAFAFIADARRECFETWPAPCTAVVSRALRES
jgi:hypothetical protein